MAERTPRANRDRLDAIIERLKKRAPNAEGVGCVLCKHILGDLLDDGELTGSLRDAHGQPTFPRSGELAHLRLEGIISPKETL